MVPGEKTSRVPLFSLDLKLQFHRIVNPRFRGWDEQKLKVQGFLMLLHKNGLEKPVVQREFFKKGGINH